MLRGCLRSLGDYGAPSVFVGLRALGFEGWEFVIEIERERKKEQLFSLDMTIEECARVLVLSYLFVCHVSGS